MGEQVRTLPSCLIISNSIPVPLFHYVNLRLDLDVCCWVPDADPVCTQLVVLRSRHVNVMAVKVQPCCKDPYLMIEHARLEQDIAQATLGDPPDVQHSDEAIHHRRTAGCVETITHSA